MQKNKRKILNILIIIIVIIISIKPFIYTYNNLFANYYIITDKEDNAEKYILRSINYNPSSYRVFKLSDYLLQAACLYKKESLLNILDEEVLHEIKEKHKDNFYIQYLYGNLGLNRNWQHLDSLSYRFLGNKRYNKMTQSILEELEKDFSLEFVENLLDFLYWQGNIGLADYFIDNYNIKNFNWVKPNNHIDYISSIKKLNTFIKEEYNLVIDKNLIPSADFSTKNEYYKNWDFSNHSNHKPYGKGSFFVDLDKINQNSMVKIFNLFLNNNGEFVSRGGMWFRERLELSEDYYIFSFDYWLKTGQEKPRFWLADDVRIPWLDEKSKKWIKVIYFLNNSKGEVGFINPLIRIYGLGSMYVDNVFFSKVKTGNENLKEPFHIHYLFYEEE